MTEPVTCPQSPNEVPLRSTHRWTSDEPLSDSSRPEFAVLFAEYLDYVWHTLRRFGVREHDLEDVTHDVFIAVLRRLDDFEPGRPVRPWLFGFAFRIASDYRDLARHRYEVVGEAGDAEDRRPTALDTAMNNEALDLALRALEDLALERRAVFILHELDEVPIPEVARALDIPLNTAYSRLRLARADLSAAVQRRSKGGP